jgi:hypothetical protein
MQGTVDRASRPRQRKKERALNNLPPLSPKELAAACLTDARSYWKAAKALNEAGNKAGISPTYFVLCHAIEVTLKAYLAAQGSGERELRDLGHHLLLVYACARKKGFKPSDHRTSEIVRWLSPFHEDLLFRYRKHLRSVALPDPGAVADVVSILVRQIEPIVIGR